MPAGLGDFKDLLEEYFANKNTPDKGSKQDKLDDIKMEIYDSYLNEDFDMKEFFSEVDKHEIKYRGPPGPEHITIAEIAKISNGHALAIVTEFTQGFKRLVLLKEELRNELELRASKKKTKKLTKNGKAWVKAAAKDMKKRTQKAKSLKKSKSSKKLKKFSLKKSKSNMISKKKYNELIKKRQHHKKLTLTERKQLDHALLMNYCSCIKKLKNKKTKKNLEYPICMSSIYNKRKFKSPKNAKSKCKKYK